MVFFTTWAIWQERNGRVFRKEFKTNQQIVDQTKTDARLWAKATKGHFLILQVEWEQRQGSA
jgi:hypothetical protein